jgi:hypothetical protein
MKAVPFGSVIENTSGLPDWSIADVPARPDSENARIRQMYVAALLAHFQAAIVPAHKMRKGSCGVSESERTYSRAVLTATGDCDEAETRRFLAENAEVDEREVRRVTLAAIAAMNEEPEREPAPKLKLPTMQALWGSRDLLAFLCENEAHLDAAEVLDGLDECERRLERERMAQKRPIMRAKRYIPADISAIAAE